MKTRCDNVKLVGYAASFKDLFGLWPATAGNDFFIRHRQRETEDDMRLLLVIDHRMEAMRAINRDQKTVKQPVGPAY